MGIYILNDEQILQIPLNNHNLPATHASCSLGRRAMLNLSRVILSLQVNLRKAYGLFWLWREISNLHNHISVEYDNKNVLIFNAMTKKMMMMQRNKKFAHSHTP